MFSSGFHVIHSHFILNTITGDLNKKVYNSIRVVNIET